MYFGPRGDGMTLGVLSPFVLTHYRVLFNFKVVQLSRWKHWLCWDWFLNGAGLATSDTIALMKQQNQVVWEKSTNDTQQVNIIGLFFFHLFHIFSYKKSVSNWHQSEVWKKKTPLPLKPLSNVPFLYRHGPPPLPQDVTHSLVWFSQYTLRRMQYLTCFFLVNKQKNKQQRFHISVFFFLEKRKKKLLLHWLDFPSKQIKHSYNLLHSMAIDCSRPCVGELGPLSNGDAAARKASLLAKEHFLNVF